MWFSTFGWLADQRIYTKEYTKVLTGVTTTKKRTQRDEEREVSRNRSSEEAGLQETDGTIGRRE